MNHLRRFSRSFGFTPAALLCLAIWLQTQVNASGDDALLRSMRDELHRSLTLHMPGLDGPYYVEYSVQDGESYMVSGTLGALLESTHHRFRQPSVELRVGSPKFDNTNCVFAGFLFAPAYNLGGMPVENDYRVLRRYFWLASDLAYKVALESISRKRAALKNYNQSEAIEDFAKAEPVKIQLEPVTTLVPISGWEDCVRRVSAVFNAHSVITQSSLRFYAVQSTFYFANTEGTEVRVPERAAYFQIKARGQAPDGMVLRDVAIFHSRDFHHLPGEEELRRAAEDVAANVAASAHSPIGESYSGPVLFEGMAAAQLFAELLGRNLALRRQPLSEPGRLVQIQESELDGRLGSRILPEWMDVWDDPVRETWQGRPLFGHYVVDLQGVPPTPLQVVNKGILRAFLLTRQPVRGFSGSNGRARLPGSFGAKAPCFGNLIVMANRTMDFHKLKQKLLQLAEERNKPYAILVRKMDFPSSLSFEEFRRLAARLSAQGARLVSSPLLVYKVEKDGRETLIRGLHFQGLSVRSLRDIVAASEQSYVFDFMENGAPLALMDVGSWVAESSVVAPAVLLDDLQLIPLEGEWPKPPVVPPPPLEFIR